MDACIWFARWQVVFRGSRRATATLLVLMVPCLGLPGCSSRSGHSSSSPLSHADSLAHQTEAAAKGDTSAVVWVTQAQLLNHGEIPDTSTTLRQLRQAADNSCLSAAVLLGDSYLTHSAQFLRHEPDFAAAEQWYRVAAIRGYGPALGRIGRLHMLEEEGTANRDSAYHYLSLAAAKGHGRSYYWLGFLAAAGNLPASELRSAVSLYSAAADSGETDAMIALGDAFRDGGLGQSKDAAASLRWYRKASNAGSAEGMRRVGDTYWAGQGVPKDELKAVAEYKRAASLGDGKAQLGLAWCYWYGRGVEEDNVLAYAWSNVSCAEFGLDEKERADRIKIRDYYANILSSADRSRSEKLASEWQLGQGIAHASYPDTTDSGRESDTKASGTAFALNTDGLVLTNYHVIEDAKTIRIEGHEGVATVVAKDVANDLAILKLPFKPKGSARFVSDASRVTLGEDVVVYGFPLKQYLSSGGNVTSGTLSALTGLGNNASNIQITAAIQPGSSGSPVFDRSGHVIGIVVSKLNDRRMAEETGNIGQTVNFAVNYATISAFLDASRVKYERAWAWPRLNRSTSDIVRDAREWTYQLEISY